MSLLLRPVRHINGTNIAGKHFLAHDLGAAIDTVANAFSLRIPVGRLQDLLLKQRGIGAAVQRREVNRHPRYHGTLDKAAS
ncbi:hypothetical protein D3C77_683980 [compost metagenome]